MRIAIGACALLVTVALVSGCDTEQPLQLDTQDVEIQILAPGAGVAVYDVWTMYEDKNNNSMFDDDYNGDGELDGNDEFVWCQAPTTASSRETQAASAPWPFSIEISLIREGQTVPERLTSEAAIAGVGVNLAAYDPLSSEGGFKVPIVISHPPGFCSDNFDLTCDPTNASSLACANDPPSGSGPCVPSGTCQVDPSVRCNAANPTCPGIGGNCIQDTTDVERTFRFTNGRRTSAASFEVLSSRRNPLYEIDPEMTCESANAGLCVGLGQNVGTCDGDSSITCDTSLYPRCPGRDFGPAMIDGQPTPFSLPIRRGDTLVVRARRLDVGPLGFNVANPPGLTSNILVEGEPVSVEGSVVQSSDDPTGAVDYFFTSR